MSARETPPIKEHPAPSGGTPNCFSRPDSVPAARPVQVLCLLSNIGSRKWEQSVNFLSTATPSSPSARADSIILQSCSRHLQSTSSAPDCSTTHPSHPSRPATPSESRHPIPSSCPARQLVSLHDWRPFCWSAKAKLRPTIIFNSHLLLISLFFFGFPNSAHRTAIPSLYRPFSL